MLNSRGKALKSISCLLSYVRRSVLPLPEGLSRALRWGRWHRLGPGGAAPAQPQLRAGTARQSPGGAAAAARASALYVIACLAHVYQTSFFIISLSMCQYFSVLQNYVLCSYLICYECFTNTTFKTVWVFQFICFQVYPSNCFQGFYPYADTLEVYS